LPVGAGVGCEDGLDGIEVDPNTKVADDEPARLAEWSWEEDGGALELPLLLFALALDP
jgi:hypothetical protein